MGGSGKSRGSKVLRGKSGMYHWVKGAPGASRGSQEVKGDVRGIQEGQGG